MAYIRGSTLARTIKSQMGVFSRRILVENVPDYYSG